MGQWLPQILRALLEREASPVWIADAGGRTLFVNGAFEECLGVRREAIQGGGPPYIWWPRDAGRHEAEMARMISGRALREGTVSVALPFQRSDGEVQDLGLLYGTMAIPDAGDGLRTLGHVAVLATPSSWAPALSDGGKPAESAVAILDALGQTGDEVTSDAAPWERLTYRERDVVQRVCAGQRPTEIATTLDISIHTVRNHLRNVYSKVGVTSQVELVRLFGVTPRR